MKTQSGKVKNKVATTLALALVGVFVALLVYAFFVHPLSPFNMLLRPKKFDFNRKSALADTYYFSEDFENAKPILEELLKENPDNPRLHRQLGITLARLGDPDGALKELEKTVALDPGYDEAYADMAAIYQSFAGQSVKMMDFPGARENLLKAEKKIEKAIEIRPNFSTYQQMQEEILKEQRNLPE